MSVPNIDNSIKPKLHLLHHNTTRHAI